MIRERFVAPIILILGLGLYFPALHMGTFVLDDGDVIAQARSLMDKPFLELFVRGGGSTYYRPVSMLSFLVDIKLWDAHPGLMHFFNLLLHVVNAILIYLIVRIFYPSRENVVRVLPLIAAVLFLVHPINTESINWISGRTDPLAAIFTLFAIYLVLLTVHDFKISRLWLASLFMIIGSMCKEVAVFSFPAITLFLLFFKFRQAGPSPVDIKWFWRLKAILPMLAGGLFYFLMRTALFNHVDKSMAKVMWEININDVKTYQSYFTAVQRLITDFGFYVKKLFIPQPLSFAIDQVHPNYLWTGIVAIILLLALIIARSYQMGMALLIALAIFPALLNALLHFAWTPYAERYLYVPTAFLCIALALPSALKNQAVQKYQRNLLIVLICIFLPTTVYRNWLWAEPLEFASLTHQQSPGNPKAWAMYAVMLANQELYDEAREEFHKALEQHPDNLYLNRSLASMEMYIHDPAAARIAMERFFNKELEPSEKILQVMLESNKERLKMKKLSTEFPEIRSELIETHLVLYKSNKQPGHLLDAAELALLNNDYHTAESYLKTLMESEGIPNKTIVKATSHLSAMKKQNRLN